MKNVIFDLGGVLIEWSPDRILESYYADRALRALLKSALFLHRDWLDLDRGSLSEAEALVRLAERTGRPARELAGLLDTVRASLHAKLPTVSLLERLFERGVPLYCLSNMSSGTFQYLRQRHSFWHVFRGIVISGEVGMMKPEPQIFEHLLSRYGLQASECVFVDDHAPNVAAAAALGLGTVWFKSAAQCEEELEIIILSR